MWNDKEYEEFIERLTNYIFLLENEYLKREKELYVKQSIYQLNYKYICENIKKTRTIFIYLIEKYQKKNQPKFYEKLKTLTIRQ